MIQPRRGLAGIALALAALTVAACAGGSGSVPNYYTAAHQTACAVPDQPTDINRTIVYTLNFANWPNTQPELEPAPTAKPYPPLTKAVKDAIQGEFNCQLNDPRGWDRAGLRFKYVNGTADLLNPWLEIDLLNQSQIGDKTSCDDNPRVLACASPTDPNHCLVKIGWKAVEQPDGSLGYEAMKRVVINHEVGHCFGFKKHSDEGPMQASPDPDDPAHRYPTSRQVNIVRNQAIHQPPFRG
jgi:hypothetical protein